MAYFIVSEWIDGWMDFVYFEFARNCFPVFNNDDGPYAEPKEFLAGFGIIDVPDLDAALEWAARHPSAGHATIEVRPLLGAHFVTSPAKPA